MASEPRIWISRPQITTEGQCDCACESSLLACDARLSDSAQVIYLGLDDEHYVIPLPDEHLLIFQPRQAANILVVNQAAWLRMRVDEFPAWQVEQCAPMFGTGRQLPASPLISAWLHITNVCNLSCPYCYVSKNGQRMDENTGLAAVEAVFRAAQQHAYSGVKLKYAGGEPTLNFPLIQKLHERARKLADESGLELQEVLLSNGVALSPGMLDYLAQEGMRLMISLDGLDEGQGKLRHLVNEQSSLPFVVQGVERALASGLKPFLSTTVTRLNLGSLPEVAAFALDHALPLSLNLYRENSCLAGNADLMAEPQAVIAGIRSALKVIEERLPPYRLIDGLLDLISFAGPHENHCAAGRDYLVIDTQGQISRCQMAMGVVVSDIHASDTLRDVRTSIDGFQSISVEEIAECSSCPWKFYCAGGCPLIASHAGGRSPYCDVYRAIFPELLRLEGLRLLKWETPLG